ncbi:MAG: HAD family hydrolase [bacterium]|nr:HAD family hydrolase [bacterium]
MSRFKALIFDLDGTLLDSLEDLASATNRMLERQGFMPHPVAAYRQFVGEGARHLVISALPVGTSEAQIEVCLEDFRRDYEKNCHIDSGLYPGVEAMLGDLEQMGLPKGILSNKPHEITCDCVGHFLQNYSFAPLWGHREGKPRKPDPTSALEMAEQMGVDPVDVLYLGDTAIDMKTAVAAGFFPMGVSWGFRPSELIEAGARKVIDHPGELAEFLKTPIG